MVGDEPLTIALGLLAHGQGHFKDTATNILETGEFVVNLVSADHPDRAACARRHRAGGVGARHAGRRKAADPRVMDRSEEHTSELQSLMPNSYAVFCLTKTMQRRKLRGSHP